MAAAAGETALPAAAGAATEHTTPPEPARAHSMPLLGADAAPAARTAPGQAPTNNNDDDDADVDQPHEGGSLRELADSPPPRPHLDGLPVSHSSPALSQLGTPAAPASAAPMPWSEPAASTLRQRRPQRQRSSLSWSETSDSFVTPVAALPKLALVPAGGGWALELAHGKLLTASDVVVIR